MTKRLDARLFFVSRAYLFIIMYVRGEGTDSGNFNRLDSLD